MAATSNPRILLIANPKAGHHALGRNWDKEIHPVLTEILGQFDFEFTTAKNHASLLTRQSLDAGYSLIVAMGGDGTINEVVNGFFPRKQDSESSACLGILPFGSGGDFIRTVGIERDYRLAAKRLLSATVQMIDIGRIDFANREFPSRYFINTAQVGLGYHIMKHVNAKSKFLPALFRYITGSFQGYLSSDNIVVDVTLDNETPRRINLTNLIIANGQYFGRGMRPAPDAKLDDGWLDLAIIKNLTFAKFMTNFHKLYLPQKNIDRNLLEQIRAKTLIIKKTNTSEFLGTEVDGEPCGEGDLTLSILPCALNLKL